MKHLTFFFLLRKNLALNLKGVMWLEMVFVTYAKTNRRMWSILTHALYERPKPEDIWNQAKLWNSSFQQ